MTTINFDEQKHNAIKLLQLGQLLESKRLFEELSIIVRNDAQIWHYLGLINAITHSYHEAISYFNNALKYNDQDSLTYTYLGQAYIQLRQYDNALIYLKKGLELNPSSIDCHNGLAITYGAQNKLQESISHYEAVTTLSPDNANVLGNLASLYERTRQKEQARHNAEKAIFLEPSQVTGNLVLARSDRSKGNYNQSENRLMSIINTHQHPSIMSYVKIELGHTLDRKKEFTRAFAAFTEGNQAWQELSKLAPFKRSYYFDRIECCKAWCNETRIKPSAPYSGESNYTNLVFYVGFPRSGTTLVEQILAANKNIVTTGEEPLIDDLIMELCGPDDLTTYPEKLNNPSDKLLTELRKKYLTRVKKATNTNDNNVTIVDKFPLNIINIGLINQIFPDAKYIIAYRNPIDVCLSCFMQSFEINPAMIHFYSLEHAAKFYAATMDLWVHYKSVLDLNYIEYHYEDLVNNTDKVTKKIIEFAGQKWSKESGSYYGKASTRQINTPSFIDVTTPIYKRAVNRWKNYKDEVSQIKPILAPYLKSFGYK